MLGFCVLLVLFFSAYGALLYANLGDNVTLPCSYGSGAKHLCWYRQVAGEQPQIISSVYKHSPNYNIFHNQFKDNKRLSVHTGEGFYHLNISNVQDSDSAMYYCGQTSITVTEFTEGTFLVLKESSKKSFLKQPESDSVQPGGPVTLNCTVLRGTSDREHSVYWFKEDSGNSHLGLIYVHTHNSSSGQCVRSSGSPADSCVYSLTKRTVKRSDAGTYYCAVASCGEILFGRGTRLDVTGDPCDTFPILVQCVVAALVVAVMLNIIQFCILCKMARKKDLDCEGSQVQPSSPENTADCQPDVQYVALDFRMRQSSSRRQRNKEEETIYSGVRRSDLE